MADNSTGIHLPPTEYFQIHQPDGICKSSQTTLLFFVSLWIPVAFASLALGPSFIRRRLGFFTEYRSPATFNSISSQVRARRVIFSLGGSIIIHTCIINVVSAKLLSRTVEGDSIPFSGVYWTWFIRPLPATIVSVLTLISPVLYLENMIEVQIVEAIIGLFSIRVFDDIHYQVEPWVEGRSMPGYSAIDHSANVGVGFWAMTAAVVIICYYCLVCDWKHAIHMLTWWFVLYNIARMAAGMGMWSGVTTLDEKVFCPSGGTEIGIALVVSFGAILDHVWRALFCVGRVEWLDLGFLNQMVNTEADGPLDITFHEDIITGRVERMEEKSFMYKKFHKSKV